VLYHYSDVRLRSPEIMTATINQTAEFEALRALEMQAQELRELLESLPDKLKWDRERFEGMREELSERCARLVRELPKPAPESAVHIAWVRTHERLSEFQSALSACSPRDRIQERYEELSRAYEQWVAAFGARMRTMGVQAPSRVTTLKPLMRARTLFHIGMGVGAVSIYQFLLTKAQAVTIMWSVFGVVLGLEVTRRIWTRWNHILLTSPLFRPIARPREYRKVNSASWYVTALSLLVPFFSQASVCAAVLVLAVADPAAAWIGRKYGTRKLYHRKSWVGSATFAVAGFLTAIGYLFAFHGSLGTSRILMGAALCALAGAIAELFSERVDDNFTVPIAGAIVASLLI